MTNFYLTNSFSIKPKYLWRDLISLSLKAKMKLRHMCKQRDRSVISWGMVLNLPFLVFPGLPSTLIISPWCSFYWGAHILPLIYNSWSWPWLVTWPPLLKGHRRWIFPRHSLGCDLPLMLLVRWSPGCRWLYSWMNRVNEMSTWYLGGYESSVLNFSCWTLDPVILIWVQSLLLSTHTNVSSGVVVTAAVVLFSCFSLSSFHLAFLFQFLLSFHMPLQLIFA